MKRIALVILSIVLLAAALGPVQAARAQAELVSAKNKIDPDLLASLNSLEPGQMATVIVSMREQADLSRPGLQSGANRQQAVIGILQDHAQASQAAILAVLNQDLAQGRVAQVIPFWVFNGLSITATADVILEIAGRADVGNITADAVDIIAVGNPMLAAPEGNLSTVNAPALWSMGYYGQGVVVASLDSGVSTDNPDLAARWRGGSNSWYDPYGQQPAPADLSGHGTWTMGVMVGGDAGGTTTGVAPQAAWIAARIFNDSGSATATAIHQAFQWVLDPDGNPATADAPDVVNNSWAYGSPGCNLGFQPDLQALRAAGILPVFAAGNYGPGGGTSVSPANNPEAFAVGATDNSDVIYYGSSRGPSACGETQSIYPELMAPGVTILTADLGGLYTTATGTSLSAPHAAGALALLLNAFPGLNVESQAAALTNTAVDLGPAGPDNDYGYGRLNILAAYQWLAAGNRVTPTPAPTATATPTPTPTAAAPVNLAWNQAVTVSSYLDSSSTGSMAVDGDPGTLWKTQKYSGKNKPSSEWLVIDLGSSYSVGQVTLDWDAYYATSYAIQISSDNSSWRTMFSTSSGNGGSDSISFTASSARYVKLLTTGWNNSSLRNWLREISIFAGGSASQPTPTATSLPTATPTPGTATTMHVGDLDGLGSPVNRKNWSATVSVLVHDAQDNPLAGASVSGSWSTGASTGCVTDGTGRCNLSSGNISTSTGSAVLTITNISYPGSSYDPAANHDPDGDSSGSVIAVARP